LVTPNFTTECGRRGSAQGAHTDPLAKSHDPPDDDAIGENVEVIIVLLAGRARGRYALEDIT
jgi:hypothetical protein